MKKIHYPDNLEERYLDTIQRNQHITIDGFYYEPYDDAYEMKRNELIRNFKLTYICEEWVDYHYFQASTNAKRRVPDTEVLKLVERAYRLPDIPPGCLQLATLYRNEPYELKPDRSGIVFLFDSKGYRDYIRLHKFIGD